MSESAHQLRRLAAQLRDAIDAKIVHPLPEPPPETVPNALRNDPAAAQQRLSSLGLDSAVAAALIDPDRPETLAAYRQNIENLIGTVKIPVGIAGPLRVQGLYARGDYTIPLATHEAALVGSYHRGCLAINAAGGCLSAAVSEGVTRSPGFAFDNLIEAGRFAAWAIEQQERFKEIAETTTSHGKLIDLRLTIESSNVYLSFIYETGDAAGQNMVTVATDAVCQYIAAESPSKPRHWYLEANLSGDKKASALSFMSVRGKKVTAEALLPPDALKNQLRTTAKAMEDYWRMSAMGGVLSGTIGVQGHFANGLAALFIACGQDAACVAEASIGTTRFEAKPDGSLYAGVTLPNLIVGTVGGGTALPSQRACLEIMGLRGDGNARAFAEVCGAALLAGELSIISSLAEGTFARAHRVLARARQRSS